jgi:hypothetical protein
MKALLALATVASLIAGPACSSGSDVEAAGDYALEGSSPGILELHVDGSFCLIQEGAEVDGTWSATGEDLSLTAKSVVREDRTITPEPDQATEEGKIQGNTITDPEGDEWVRTDSPPIDCPSDRSTRSEADAAASATPSARTSPTPAMSAEGLMTYSGHGITFAYPTEWHDLDWPRSDATWSVELGGAPGTGYVSIEAVETTVEITDVQLDRFARGFFEFVQSKAAGDRPRGPITEIRVGGMPALRARFAGDLGYKTAVVFTNGSTAFALSCFTPDAAPDEDCGAVLSSWRFAE